MDDDMKLLDTRALAKALGVATKTINRWLQSGTLPRPLIDTPEKKYWSQPQIQRWQQAEDRQCSPS